MRKKIQIIFIALLCFGWFGIASAAETGFHPAIGEIRLNLPGAESAVVTPDGGLALWASKSGLVAGFPVFEDSKVFVSSPVLADVNADGIKEIVVLTRDTGDVFGASVYNGYGTLLASAPLGAVTAYYDPTALVSANGVKDGFVVGTNEGDALLFTYNNGQLASEKLASFGVPISVSATVSGDKIFVTSPLNEEIAVLAKNGAVWEQTQIIQVGQPVIYPVVSDGQNNVFAVTDDSSLTAINLDSGEKLANFPIALPSAPISSPVLADITADNAGNEISVLMTNGDRGIYDQTGGEILSGLPKKSFVESSLDTPEYGGGLVSSISNFGISVFSKTKQILSSVFSRIKLVFSSTPDGGGLWTSLSFDEPANSVIFIDSSGNDNSAICNTATCPETGAIGNVNKSLELNGVDDFVEVKNADAFAPSEAVTVEAWVRPELKNPTDITGMVIASKQRTYELNVINPKSQTLQAIIRNTAGQKVSVVVSKAYKLNEWSHVVMTYDGANIKLYVNGALKGTSPQTGLIMSSPYPLEIGKLTNGLFYLGGIDELKVYNQALTPEEIQQKYNQTKTL